jgi:hypothetical protein
MPTVLADGSNYTIRYVIGPDRTVGVAAQADGSSFGVVVVSGDRILAHVRSVPTSDGPFFDAFVFYDGAIYWTETTIGADGTDITALWAVALAADSVGEPRVVVPDMGFAQLSGSAYDVVVADGRISWAAVAGVQQPSTLVRSVAVAGGPTGERTFSGSWRQIERPWLASTSPGSMVLLNQDTGAEVTVPGSDVAPTDCTPQRCRVRVTSAGDTVRLELVAPDGSGRTRIAGPATFFAAVDPLVLGRYELLSETGGDLTPGQMRLLLHDAATGRTTEVETGPRSQVAVRDGWAWWLAGDFSAPVWHALHLAALSRDVSRDGGALPGPDVVALDADLLGNDAQPHQPGKDRAAYAEREHRLQGGRDRDQPEQDVAGANLVEPEHQHRRRSRDHRADPLGEPLRRPGHQLRRAIQCRRDHPGDQLTERTERRAGQHPGQEAVGDHRGQPPGIEDDRHQ